MRVFAGTKFGMRQTKTTMYRVIRNRVMECVYYVDTNDLDAAIDDAENLELPDWKFDLVEDSFEYEDCSDQDIAGCDVWTGGPDGEWTTA
jgi:hypothetical protein